MLWFSLINFAGLVGQTRWTTSACTQIQDNWIRAFPLIGTTLRNFPKQSFPEG